MDYYGQPEYDEPPAFPEVPGNPFLLPVWIIEVIAFVTLVFPITMFIKLIQLLFFADKKGAFPKYVAPWLKGQFLGPRADPFGVIGNNLLGTIKGRGTAKTGSSDLLTAGSCVFASTNNVQGRQQWWRSFEALGFIWRFLFISDTDVELVEIPDLGWNTTLRVDFVRDRVALVRKPRKKDPDIFLKFFDNAKGYRARYPSYRAAYGFTVAAYYADIVEKGKTYVNRPDDNTRVEIVTHINPKSPSNIQAMQKSFLASGMPESEAEAKIDKILHGDDRYITSRRFEFLATDMSFELLEPRDYPNLFVCFDRQSSYSPPIGALVDLTDGAISIDRAKTLYENANQQLYEEFAYLIGCSQNGWDYGYHPDPAGSYEIMMGVKADRILAEINEVAIGDWISYEDLRVPVYDDNGNMLPLSVSKEVENEDGIQAISRDQYDNDKRGTPDLTRVFYLNPNVYGGSYSNPPVYIKQYKPDGWLSLINILFPERSPCTPRAESFVRFDDIKAYIDSTYPRIPEDKRLRGNEDCVFEAPFNRILTRPAKAAIRGIIMSAIRIYASVSFVKCLPTFTTIAPEFKTNYSNIFAAYIVERMRESLFAAGGNFWNNFNDTEFWYAFLEQSVQFYTDRLNDDQDDFVTPDSVPVAVAAAIHKMDDLQENYQYPYNFKKFSGEDYGTFESIKSFRESKNLEAVRSVESEAKLVLQELVKEQLNIIGEAFLKNAEQAQLGAQIYNLDYWLMENFCDIGEYNLRLQGKHIEQPKPGGGLGVGSNLYTAGNQLALPSGTPYVGEYHTHLDESGAVIYMVGPTHTNEEHDKLLPYAKEMEVYSVAHHATSTHVMETARPIGDIQSATSAHRSVSSAKLCYMSKVIFINGTAYSNDEAVAKIRAHLNGNISDYYPGDMKLIFDPDTQRPIGVEGNIGVQYGLEFGVSGGRVITTKIDALDLPVGEFKGIEPNSKILLCLINQLIDEPEYRMLVDYVFGMKKATAMMAIYNDMGLVPSVGELTVRKNDMTGGTLLDSMTAAFGGGGESGDELKPGMRADGFSYSVKEINGEEVGVETKIDEGYTFGWSSEDDRNSLFSSFGYVDFDEWDQVLMRKSARALKNVFKPHYRNRKFVVEDDEGPSPAEQFISNITERFRFNPAVRLMPSSRRKYIRSNPFDADGNLCVKKN